MKKLFLFVILSGFVLSVYAQFAWELSGNSNVSPSNFLGTIEPVPLIFKTNNTESMRLLPDKLSLGIGTPTPNALLYLYYNADIYGLEETIDFLHMTAVSENNPLAELRLFSLGKDIYLKQNLQSDFVIEGPSGGLKIRPSGNIYIPNGSVCIGGEENEERNEKLYVDGDAVIDGNISADVAKINKSIFFPGNRLVFTCPSSARDEDDDRGLPPPLPEQNPVTTVMTLQYVNKETCLGIGGFSPSHNLFVRGTGMISNRLTLKSTSSISDRFSDLGLQIGDTWTFFDMLNAKIMGYNSLFINNASPTRHTNGAASAVMMNTNGSIQLCTAPYGIGDLSWNYFTMLNNGNVGIGTSDPTKQLHVQGDTYLSGNVGIGTSNTFGYTLAVNGNIGCKEVKVEVSNDWPDYVFAPEYDLKSLAELDSYVKEYQRLPEMPSAEQVAKEGVELSKMNVLLLKKIEELTLYIIQQNARIEALEKGR